MAAINLNEIHENGKIIFKKRSAGTKFHGKTTIKI